ncbi:HD domain-containing protein [Candidatus Peregrinibacteria bacterium]|nr:HD domain-containing protein [Candidatus Peregrinibacteria bacterium]
MPLKKPDDIRSDELTAGEIKDICREIGARNLGKEKNPSEYATSNAEAERPHGPDEPRRTAYGYEYARDPFREDCERIVYSKASERMWGKTQMIPIPQRAHITNRGIHTDRVSQTARSIARELGMNEDLTEAIGRGHDLGHPPLGHQGEVLLTTALFSALAKAKNEDGEVRELLELLGEDRQNLLKILGMFKHNIQGLNVVDRIESRRGFPAAGLNLTNHVRHGIISHDGEKDVYRVKPRLGIKGEAIEEDIKGYRQRIIEASALLDFAGDLRDANDGEIKIAVAQIINRVHKGDGDKEKGVTITPVTMEGGIIMMVDVLQYVGEDLEDLISLGVVERKHIPPEIVQVLGNNGSDIIHTLLSDLVVHSYGQGHLCYSEKVADALQKLKRDFLYKYYYKVNSWVEAEAQDPRIAKHAGNLQERMNYLFRKYLKALRYTYKHPGCQIVAGYMDGRDMHDYYAKMSLGYPVSMCQTVVDYIAGFTDQFFFEESGKLDE